MGLSWSCALEQEGSALKIAECFGWPPGAILSVRQPVDGGRQQSLMVWIDWCRLECHLQMVAGRARELERFLRPIVAH